jgi:hypothetical protein
MRFTRLRGPKTPPRQHSQNHYGQRSESLATLWNDPPRGTVGSCRLARGKRHSCGAPLWNILSASTAAAAASFSARAARAEATRCQRAGPRRVRRAASRQGLHRPAGTACRLPGTRVTRIQVFVNGRLKRALRMGALERRLTRRLRLGPGRHRLRVRVTFQRGSGSPPVTLRRAIRVCKARARPSFTG